MTMTSGANSLERNEARLISTDNEKLGFHFNNGREYEDVYSELPGIYGFFRETTELDGGGLRNNKKGSATEDGIIKGCLIIFGLASGPVLTRVTITLMSVERSHV